MNLNVWRWIQGLRKLLSTRQPEPARQAERIVDMQLHTVLPTKAGVVAVVMYFILHNDLFSEQETIRRVAMDLLYKYFMVFLILNFIAFLLFLFWRRLPPGLFQWLAFTLGLLDGLFVAGLTFITGGFESIVYWVFPGLIVLNALSIPLAMPQIVLNLSLSAFYLTAGILDIKIPIAERVNVSNRAIRPVGGHGLTTNTNAITPLVHTNAALTSPNTNRLSRPGTARGVDSPYITTPDEIPTESLLPRLFVLWLLTACSFGVQVLARRSIDEQLEFALREAQLRSAGRLAAEFAHQIKNPLAIINNAAFSMRRALKDGTRDVSRQIDIIQEEVERSDKIVTQVIGYAQLTEGRVEKLDVVEELDRAIGQVFPPAVDCGVRVERRYAWDLPPLLMQRRHLEEIMVNLLRNAREALNDHGVVSVTAALRADDSIEISVRDNGPGVPPDKLERIFEAYYTTREKGTGLGLAIVKNNTELYTGTVRVESELGKGARFIVSFPAKTAVSPAKPR